jgi:hypothetical protein
VLGLVTSIATSRTWAQSADYGCFSEPLTTDEAEQLPHPGPIPSVLCPAPTDPSCTVTPIPTVESVKKDDEPGADLANEARIVGAVATETTVPFKALKVHVQYLPTGNSTYVDLWHEQVGQATRPYITSRDALLTQNRIPGGGGDSYEFGATGLVEGRPHRVRVSQCREESGDTGCTCWSSWRTWTQQATFPSVPLGTVTPQLAQDDFNRRDSLPKRNTGGQPPASGKGDGAGPAWMDEWVTLMGNPVANGTQIEIDATSGRRYLEVPAAGAVMYMADAAQDPHTWAEFEVRALETGAEQNYNVDVHARFMAIADQTTFNVYSYMVKMPHEPDWGSGPINEETLRIYRNEGGALGIGAAPIFEKTLADLADDSLIDTCENTSQLLSGGSTAILRLRVENLFGNPEITVRVGWNCSPASCANECKWVETDTEVGFGHALFLAEDHWALQSHHWKIRLDDFRAGSDEDEP